MRVINQLTTPGGIRSVRLEPELITVRTYDNKLIMYRRVENEDVSLEKDVLRRRTLPA